MIGWIKLHRCLMEKAFFRKDSEKVHLWILLLFKASFSKREEMLGGKPFTCHPGQFTTGRKQLSEECNISESKVERILTYFEKIEHQIEQQKTNKNRLITILNWNKYQVIEQQIEQQPNNNRTTTEQQLNTLKEVKKERGKEEKNKIYIDFFNDFFWPEYPERNGIKAGKKSALAQIKKLNLKNGDFENLKKAVNNYKIGCNGYPKDAERFLRNEFWEDWINYQYVETDPIKLYEQKIKQEMEAEQ